MTTKHCNTIRNMAASLKHLNAATGQRYRIRRKDGQYILVSSQGAEYPPRTAYEMRETLLSMTTYAKGRT